jgi:hypothetical protein
MAQWRVEGADLVLELSAMEKAEATNGNVLRGRNCGVVVHGKGSAVVIELSAAEYQRLVLTDERSDETVTTIGSALPTP